MCKIMLGTGLIVAYAYMTEFWTAWYSTNHFEKFTFWNRVFGPYMFGWIIMTFCNVVSPQILWSSRMRKNLWVVMACAIFAMPRLARWVISPLQRVRVSASRSCLSADAAATLPTHMTPASHSGSKMMMMLHSCVCSLGPVQVSVRELAGKNSDAVIIGMVVTDMTEARRTEEMLRALTHRVVQVQEAESGRVDLELHDHITQLLCANGFRSETLANNLSAREPPATKDAIAPGQLLGGGGAEVGGGHVGGGLPRRLGPDWRHSSLPGNRVVEVC